MNIIFTFKITFCLFFTVILVYTNCHLFTQKRALSSQNSIKYYLPCTNAVKSAHNIKYHFQSNHSEFILDSSHCSILDAGSARKIELIIVSDDLLDNNA